MFFLKRALFCTPEALAFLSWHPARTLSPGRATLSCVVHSECSTYFQHWVSGLHTVPLSLVSDEVTQITTFPFPEPKPVDFFMKVCPGDWTFAQSGSTVVLLKVLLVRYHFELEQQLRGCVHKTCYGVWWVSVLSLTFVSSSKINPFLRASAAPSCSAPPIGLWEVVSIMRQSSVGKRLLLCKELNIF